jgi:hypothetical protein
LEKNSQLVVGSATEANSLVYVGVTGELLCFDNTSITKEDNATGIVTVELDNDSTLSVYTHSEVTIHGLLKSDPAAFQVDNSIINMNNDTDSDGFSTLTVDGFKLQSCNIFLDYGKWLNEAYLFGSITTTGDLTDQSTDTNCNLYLNTIDAPDGSTDWVIFGDSGSNGLNLAAMGVIQNGAYANWVVDVSDPDILSFKRGS